MLVTCSCGLFCTLQARHVRNQTRASFPEGIVERIKKYSVEFDRDWKDNVVVPRS
jgi:hypothetical protein